jgi:hypothetical protein
MQQGLQTQIYCWIYQLMLPQGGQSESLQNKSVGAAAKVGAGKALMAQLQSQLPLSLTNLNLLQIG